MFDDLMVAATAVSSFNNAALLNPFFFVVGLLTVPLFLFVYLYGRDFVSKFGWNNQNAESKTSFWSAVFLIAFIILFGGNYAVIRDGISVLPILLAIILFVLMIVVSNNMVQLKYIEKIHNKKSKWLVLCLLLLCATCSGMTKWWGMLLLLSAVVCGTIVGCRLKKDISWIITTSLIYGMMTVLVLMQPEYFRFGQLGHLTVVHLFGILLTGFFVITTVVTKYVKSRGKIRQSAFIKLRWLFRIVSLLALILFISTESVPVFLGLMVSVGFLESLSVYHSKKCSENMFRQSWAWVIMCLGILIMCPVISAIGIIYLTFIPNRGKATDYLRLL